MPVEAMPTEPPAPLGGTVHYRREYRDILGRGMRGQVSITGSTRTDDGGRVVIPARVVVEVAAGVLDVDLPPDTYTLSAALRTADGDRVTDTDTVTLD